MGEIHDCGDQQLVFPPCSTTDLASKYLEFSVILCFPGTSDKMTATLSELLGLAVRLLQCCNPVIAWSYWGLIVISLVFYAHMRLGKCQRILFQHKLIFDGREPFKEILGNREGVEGSQGGSNKKLCLYT